MSEKRLTDMSQEELDAMNARNNEAFKLFQEYKAILHSQRGKMLPLSQDAANKLNDQLFDIRKKRQGKRSYTLE